jgi:carbon-monoxide dehydrogenase medium subunit
MAQMAPVHAYYAPETIEECLDVLERESGRVMVLAGGQAILPILKTRGIRPEVLLDLGRVSQLRAQSVRVAEGSVLEVGAMRRHRDLWADALVARDWSALADAAWTIGDRQVQSRGTLGGNLVFGTVLTDMKQVAMCLDAELVIVGRGGTRSVRALSHFADDAQRLLEPHELLQGVRFPSVGVRGGSAYKKYGLTANGRPVVGVASLVKLDDAGRCAEARIVVGGLVPGPNVATAAAESLVGKALNEETMAAAAEIAATEVKPQSDGRASAAYRRRLVRGYVIQTVSLAYKRAQEGVQ